MKSRDEAIEFFTNEGRNFLSHVLDRLDGTVDLSVKLFEHDRTRVVDHYSPEYDIGAEDARTAYTRGVLDEAFKRFTETKR